LSKRTVAAGAALLGLALAPAAVAEAKPVKRTVQVGDYFFSPERLSVPNGSTITWRWPSIPGDLHDVVSVRRPKGVKRFRSQLAASDYRYRRTLTRAGRYVILCSLHPQMRQTIRVRR
jgi:plastocyanin